MGHVRGCRSPALALVLAAAAPAPSSPPSAPDHSPVSVVTTAVHELEDALKKSNKQWFNAIVALVGGVLLVFFSEKALEVVVMGVSAVIACNLGMKEVSTFWRSDIQSFAHGPLRMVIGLEFGLLGALIAKQGYKGILVAIAVVAGFTLSGHLEAYLVEETGSVNKWCTVFLYSVITIVFILVVVPLQRRQARGAQRSQDEPKGLYVHLLIFVCPWIGAPLIMSALWYFVTLVVALKDKSADMAPWLSFLDQLLSPSASPVGVLTKYHFEVMKREVGYDRLIGLVGWLCFTIAGIVYQRKERKDEKPKGRVIVSPGPAPVDTGGIREPLLARESNERSP